MGNDPEASSAADMHVTAPHVLRTGMEETGSLLVSQMMAEGHVARAPWFPPLSRDLQSLVLQTARIRIVAAGTTVARRGVIPHQWIGVVHGVLKATACNADGRASSYVLATRSQWIDGAEIVHGSPRLHDVVAVSDSVVIVIASRVFQNLISSSVEFCNFVLRQTSDQLRNFHERADRGRNLSNTTLVAQTIVELGDELLEARTGAVELKQEDIAEFVGLTRQTVNQILRELAVEGLVRTRYCRVEVSDLKALRSFARLNPVQARNPSATSSIVRVPTD